MLKDCLEIFKREYDQKGEGYITDGYVLGDGSYILVDEDGNISDILEVDKKNIDNTSLLYEYFAQRDYLSKLLDMNKPMDQSKVIHSNNYLSFFIKKENINSGKLKDETIENYYKVLIDPREKYKGDKEKLRMYEEVEKKHGKAVDWNVQFCKKWIENNIYNILNKVKNDKNYVKIFFKRDLDEYVKESEKYIIPNIYNSNQYNEHINEEVFGLPNDNMGLNAKKPYLENKTRKNTLPYLISIDDVILQKKFFDLLMNFAASGNQNIYIRDGYIGSKPDNDFSGYFLRIKKGKEAEIHDFDIITSLKQEIKGLEVKQVIPIDYGNLKQTLDYEDIKNIGILEALVSEVFFNKFLSTNYFTEAKDISLNDFRVKENLLKSRTAFFNWFYKGNKAIISSIIGQITMDLIKNSICNEYYIKASEQFNLRAALLEYFKGGEIMPDVLTGIADKLRLKVNGNSTDKIESDMEYYFAAGQVVSYLISLNRSNKKMHSLINPILNCKSDLKLKGEIEKLFKKYNYTIKNENKRFNNMLSMVLGYIPEGEVKTDQLIAGYLYSNLIYEKKEGGN